MYSPVMHQDFVRIRHLKTQAFLRATNVPIQEIRPHGLFGLIRKTQIIEGRYYLAGSPEKIDSSTVWKITKLNCFDLELYYGDLVSLKSALSNFYVNIDGNFRSEATNQVSAHLTQKAQTFVLQSATQDLKSHCSVGNQPVKFVSIDGLFTLHSHKDQYINKEVKKFQEVTGFHERDDNDYWIIEKLDEQESYNPQGFFNSNPGSGLRIQVNQSDKVIIRHVYSSLCLSADAKGFAMNHFPRNQRDAFELIKVPIKPKSDSKEISNQSTIILRNVMNQKFLYWQNDRLVFEDSHLEPWVVHLSSNETLNEESPFMLYCETPKSYLTYFPIDEKLLIPKLDMQRESSFQSLWVIERIASIVNY